MSGARFTVRGARGGRPAIGASFTGYGSHTTCYSVETPEGILVVDAGSGIWSLSEACLAAGPGKPIAIFFTHFHFDHVMGLRAFDPLFSEGFTLQLYGACPSADFPWPDVLTDLFDAPYWPVPLRSASASVSYMDLDQQQGPISLFGSTISWCELTHSQRCLGYRIDLPSHRLVILTDHEPQRHPDQAIQAFAAGADTLVMDAQYAPDEYVSHQGWGHGTWQDAASMAIETGAGRLLLCHHDPTRTDAQLDEIQHLAQAVFPDTVIAHEGMSLEL